MADLIPVSYKLLKGMNESLILNVIRHNKYVSRSEIAKITNLTPPTVTNIINKLLEDGLVKEDKLGESSGGRPPVILKINNEAFDIIVIIIGTDIMEEYLLDAELTIKESKVDNIKKEDSESIFKLLFDRIRHLKDISKKEIAGIGIVVRGPVKSSEGISVFSPNIGWRNVPIKDMIEKEFGIPTFVENDVRAMALGEFYNGIAKNVGNVVFLKVGHGIGSTIILDGKIYRGINDMAGEIGHTTIDVAGPKCSCGNYGCFEALASEKALVNNVVKRIKEGSYSLVSEYVNGDLENITTRFVYKAAEEGDEVALSELNKIAIYLGIGIANIVNVFSPELVLISGGIVRGRKFIEDVVLETIKKRSFEANYSSCSIAFSNPDYNTALMGISNIILDSIL
ncbi:MULTISPECIES: ROK family transcriptional regulator [unclassified Thermoanaerobacterium]|uniref:ROK family transcriptional regulator n=1 Tax=unclassified Thermoanaerobacterium TaxID=2622527 RepID=UPI000A151E6A|nr:MULTISPECIES: ROK family transcriptional regulator [unclassified Thermoanaerobacterium]MDE4541165.1 ROK family transcriptional regulator [Thermoanaerobacterium sp. R66]ORX23753.1 transcriptional regulator [Thermoanaerobacterium sp. PSU-2]HHV75017.1 ROK family transcriptional regulator [Thermoanaerobacterium sp.]